MTLASAPRWMPSPNHGARRGGPIDMLVLHYTGMPSAAAALQRLCDPASEVSAHYLIDEEGRITQLVDEERRAWHAGRAFWAGEEDVNSRSIGIELAHPGPSSSALSYPAVQMAALIELARDIVARRPIPAWRVLGHSDVAPERKEDPGSWFDWAALAEGGVGLWPPAWDNIPCDDAETALRRIGYRDASPLAVAAFQRHWRPSRVDGELDPETRARIATVAALVPEVA